jgi:predicted enzyme related to lactoylglutathione lyase
LIFPQVAVAGEHVLGPELRLPTGLTHRRGHVGRSPSITIETDDCRKTVEELKSRGVEFVSDVLEFPWGYVAQFEDPDGNLLQLREGR